MKNNTKKIELLEAAYELFITKGYENTSVDEIISKVGIAKGTYYYYFESKEQTLEEVINMMISKGVEIANQVLQSDMSLENKILGIIMAIRPNIEEIKVQEAINKPENIVMHKKVNEKIVDELTPLLAEVVKDGIKAGICDCTNIEERIKMILIMSSELFDENENPQKYAEVFIDTVEKMLGTKKGALSFIEKLIG